MLALDICCGTKSATAAMHSRGWNRITLDIDPLFEPDIVADVRGWSWTGARPDLIWFSPPCDEFARDWMPWVSFEGDPDMSIVEACLRIVEESKPRYWILENVQGALDILKPLIGEPRLKHKPYFFWGFFPDLGDVRPVLKKKESMSSRDKVKRAMIPYEFSKALALAVESQQSMFDVLGD
jgi:hypothetical protein